MTVIQINPTCTAGSTGKICLAISRLLSAEGVENYILHTQDECQYPLGVLCAKRSYIKLQALLSRIKGNFGFNSKAITKKMIAVMEEKHPSVVHLHNLHSHNCDLEMLFSYFRKKEIKLFWTFHDCWALPGYCPYFDAVQCQRWKATCHSCPQRRQYSWFFDRSATLHKRKKKLLSGLDLTVVAPSEWIAGITRASFLKDSPVRVIHNGIDLSVFHPTESDFREKYRCENKKIVLGVAFDWGHRKGLDVFADLASTLPQDYQIVLVGTNDAIDRSLPDNVISIHRTQDQAELARIYAAADVFVNPTREENYPTVNMEALACGTPVVTFATGGSPEIIDGSCGVSVPCDDVDALRAEIVRVCEQQPYSQDACLKRAEAFDKDACFRAYLTLYKEVDP